MKLLYFSWVRERIGTGEEDVVLPPDLATLNDLVDWLSLRSDGHAHALADRGRLRAAVDGVFVPLTAPVDRAAEIALFPPVTGG